MIVLRAVVDNKRIYSVAGTSAFFSTLFLCITVLHNLKSCLFLNFMICSGVYGNELFDCRIVHAHKKKFVDLLSFHFCVYLFVYTILRTESHRC